MSITLAKKCQICGNIRRDVLAYQECRCIIHPFYTPEKERFIKSQVEMLIEFHQICIKSPNKEIIIQIILFFTNLDPEVRGLITNYNRHIFDCFKNTITSIWGSDPLMVYKYLMMLYLTSKKNAHLLKLDICLFIGNDISCKITSCSPFCSAHNGWLYIMDNELQHYLPEDIALLCGNYLQPGYRSVKVCNSNVKKRKI